MRGYGNYDDIPRKLRKGITENSQKQNSKNEERSEAKWENTKKVVKRFVSELAGYEERKKWNVWYDVECQIKV